MTGTQRAYSAPAAPHAPSDGVRLSTGQTAGVVAACAHQAPADLPYPLGSTAAADWTWGYSQARTVMASTRTHLLQLCLQPGRLSGSLV